MKAAAPVTWLGPPGGPPALVLHGFLGRGSDWREVADAAGIRAAAPDLPGHGAWTQAPDAAFSLEGAADAVAGVAASAFDRPPLLVGYSLGGRIAAHAAIRHPDGFRGLVLVSAHPGLEADDERRDRIAADRSRAAAVRVDLDRFLATWHAQPLFATLPAQLTDSLVRERRSGDPDALARALDGFSLGRQAPLTEALQALAVPVMAVAGATDRRYADLARMLAPSIPCRILPGAGHNLPREAPGALAAAIREFLATLDTLHG